MDRSKSRTKMKLLFVVSRNDNLSENVYAAYPNAVCLAHVRTQIADYELLCEADGIDFSEDSVLADAFGLPPSWWSKQRGNDSSRRIG